MVLPPLRKHATLSEVSTGLLSHPLTATVYSSFVFDTLLLYTPSIQSIVLEKIIVLAREIYYMDFITIDDNLHNGQRELSDDILYYLHAYDESSSTLY